MTLCAKINSKNLPFLSLQKFCTHQCPPRLIDLYFQNKHNIDRWEYQHSKINNKLRDSVTGGRRHTDLIGEEKRKKNHKNRKYKRRKKNCILTSNNNNFDKNNRRMSVIMNLNSLCLGVIVICSVKKIFKKILFFLFLLYLLLSFIHNSVYNCSCICFSSMFQGGLQIDGRERERVRR